MALTLRPATPADAHHIVDIYFSAFSQDPISLLCFPRTAAVHAFWLAMITDELSDPAAHFLCVTAGDAVVAFGQWNAPSKPAPLALPAWPAGADVALADSFFGGLFSAHERLMGRKPHWYLELVATRPEFRGKGAAGMLLRWGLERADRDGVEAYLEASPEGKPIYEHFGFGELESMVIDLEGKGLAEKEFVEVFMVRPVAGQRKEA
jgi:GNAT superfamily N-acetyltransferase